MTPSSHFPETIRRNIEAVAKLEQAFLRHRSRTERVGDAVGSFAGTMWFVILHLVWFGFWVTINARLVPGIPAFDPYPFIFLSMVVSLEGVLLSTFVLIKQNRMSRRQDERAQLDLQVNLLAESESTKSLQLLQRLCAHLGVEDGSKDAEVEELIQDTAIEALAEDIKRELPE